MPVYQCVSTEGAINRKLRPELAKALTEIHCEVTGAAPEFVQVLFLELTANAAYTNGKTSRMTNIAGYIRAGRSRDIREQLYGRINSRWIELTGISADQLKIILFDVPASWIMQGGQMMPHPGHDQEWLDRLRVVEK